MLIDGAVPWGLLAAIGWGGGDFAGGLSARRSPLFGVAIAVQLFSLVLAVIVGPLVGEAPPTTADIAWAAASGVAGAVGLLLLYQGLATGRMAIVAPVCAVLTAAVPVLVGGILQGPPGPVRAAGIGAAILAVLVVSRSSGPGARRDGLWLGVGAGLALASYSVCVSRIVPGHVWFPMAIARLVDLLVVLALVLATRRPWRIPGPVLPLVVLTAVLDAVGNASFFLAAQSGRLDVAAVLSSLYPVTTVLLATFVLRERLVRGHAWGIGIAFVAIVMIAGG